jgi:hypothetical protein
MRSTLLAAALLAAVSSGAGAIDYSCVGSGHGQGAPGRDNPCPGSELMLTSDGTFEAACGWCCEGVLPPDWGAWAEGYTATGTICGIQFWFSTIPDWPQDRTMDAYVYSSDGVNPAEVLSLTTGIDPNPIAVWPDMSSRDVPIADTPVDGEFFVGYWGNWPNGTEGWHTGCDLDGPQGKPRTKIAAGLGYPTGWHDPSIVFGPTRNNGIGPWLRSDGVPARNTSWGVVKSLYR